MIEEFIKSSDQERKNIIQKAAFDLGMRFDVIEKDIWVCYVLDKLFSLKELQGKFVFKGGTCLSKAYGLIERFSEDIDLTISRKFLEIPEGLTKIKTIKSRTRKAAEDFIKNEIYQSLNKVFSKELENSNWSLKISEEDQSTLLFQFPISDDGKRSMTTKNGDNITTKEGSNLMVNLGYYNYIKPNIKLEFGALGDDWPMQEKTVEPYAKKILPDFFNSTKVNTLDVKRNFIEKLLILHSICFRPIEKPLKHHYSRHYYDIFCLIKSGIAKEALKFPEILQSVKENKITFWNESWKPYDNINSFSDIKLIPSDQLRLKELEQDYDIMKEMFFNNYPSFLEVIDELRGFEEFLIAE